MLYKTFIEVVGVRLASVMYASRFPHKKKENLPSNTSNRATPLPYRQTNSLYLKVG